MEALTDPTPVSMAAPVNRPEPVIILEPVLEHEARHNNEPGGNNSDDDFSDEHIVIQEPVNTRATEDTDDAADTAIADTTIDSVVPETPSGSYNMRDTQNRELPLVVQKDLQLIRKA
ncbi:hypothetical protein A2U01_0015425 [Trifolium medium]|uniref:Uncharacterized protein n=1 Tax=Trifolium medium TaxID=97028 RepID=A0A392N7J9_9FABA|nr:hypothetical protein [Trifolium medium]